MSEFPRAEKDILTLHTDKKMRISYLQNSETVHFEATHTEPNSGGPDTLTRVWMNQKWL